MLSWVHILKQHQQKQLQGVSETPNSCDDPHSGALRNALSTVKVFIRQPAMRRPRMLIMFPALCLQAMISRSQERTQSMLRESLLGTLDPCASVRCVLLTTRCLYESLFNECNSPLSLQGSRAAGGSVQEGHRAPACGAAVRAVNQNVDRVGGLVMQFAVFINKNVLSDLHNF